MLERDCIRPKIFSSHNTTAITTTAFRIDLMELAIGMKRFTSLWLVKTKRRPVFSLKTLLSMNGRELREGGLRSQDRLGKEWKSSTRRARNGFPLPLMMQRSSSRL